MTCLERRWSSRTLLQWLGAALCVALANPGWAVPSFARQTGMACAACHTVFPELTPFGREFKLNGYVLDNIKQVTGIDTTDRPTLAINSIPPISLMAQISYTHTRAALPDSAISGALAKDGDLLFPQQVSFFYAGKIADGLGAFIQLTYDGVGDSFGFDNTDIRYAHHWSFGGSNGNDHSLIVGVTLNNNPTVQDVWNTTPAWAFPYAVSNLGNSGPSTSTMIEGAFAAHVVGAGAYTFINDLLYLEATAYRTLDPKAQNSLGVDPTGVGLLNNAAPYWRIALEPNWGPHSFMIGTFGMQANVNQWNPFPVTTPQSDKITDIGFDTQYQYQGSNYWLTLRGSYIREFQKFDSSFVNGLSSNPTDVLNSLRLLASFAYGGDNRIVFTGQYFNVWGTPDVLAYAGDSSGFTAEIAYIPFSAGKAPGWPWFNTRIGLNYTYYYKANGTTVGAQDNNTLFLYAWFAM